MQTISFYSYKGGTGRTLLVANVARHLARFDKKVFVIDFDLEAPGLHYKFNLDREEKPIEIKRGSVDYVHEFVMQGHVRKSVRDYVVDVPVSQASDAVIHLMPAGTVPSADYWKKLSEINWHDLFYGVNPQGAPLFLELKESIEEELAPDFLLVDSRTGITEIGGVATTILPEKLVCLVLANRENLEGSRAVLRSLGRGPLLPERKPPEIIPVLSRIPASAEEEDRIKGEILEFLNEEAEELENTLQLPEIFVLHSEPELQVAECLRVGGDKAPEESILLRDYLRLFMRIVPPKELQPHIGVFIDQAKAQMLDHPDEAEEVLKALLSWGHPDAHRALLKFQRLRNAPGDEILWTAQSLFGITQKADDELLWNVVQSHFVELEPKSRRLPLKGRIGDVDLLRFVVDVWRAAGANDKKVGLDLAESYDNFGEKGHAADTLLELVKNVGADADAVTQCVRQLRRAQRSSEAREVIERYRADLADHSAFLSLWAEFTIQERDREFQNRLLEPPHLDRLKKSEPLLAYRLLALAGQFDEAKNLSEFVLQHALRDGPSRHLSEIGNLFAEIGDFKRYEKAVRDALGNKEGDEFLRMAKNDMSRRRRFG